MDHDRARVRDCQSRDRQPFAMVGMIDHCEVHWVLPQMRYLRGAR
jgi:hypothetical protein